MRVLLTTDTIGGVWTFTKELTNQLLDRGHAVALVSFGRLPTPGQSRWASSTLKLYPRHFHCDFSSTPLEWMSDNRSVQMDGERLLLEVAAHFAPDLLHANQFCYGSLPSSLPRLVTAHSDVHSWAAACRPQGLPPSSWLSIYNSTVQEGLSAADAVVAPTNWMLRALRKNFSLPPIKRTILNGRTAPLRWSRSQGSLQAVTSGRMWDEGKGLAVLRDVRASFPIFVAGDLEHQTEQADSCIGTATLAGTLEEEELLALFAASAIYIVTSIYEPFGLAPLEAALQGCAIVANDIPSLREVWGEAAIYFRGSMSLSQQLAKLAESPEFLANVQLACRTRALQFTARRMADQYLFLYEKLLISHPCGSSETELATHAF